MQENLSETVVKGFLNVNHESLIKLCLDMELITEDETMNLTSWFPLWRKALGRVAENNLHSQLWDRLAKHGVVYGENPYEVAALVAELEFNVSRGFESRMKIEAERSQTARQMYECMKTWEKPANVDRDKELQSDRVAAALGVDADELDAFREETVETRIKQFLKSKCVGHEWSDTNGKHELYYTSYRLEFKPSEELIVFERLSVPSDGTEWEMFTYSWHDWLGFDDSLIKNLLISLGDWKEIRTVIAGVVDLLHGRVEQGA